MPEAVSPAMRFTSSTEVLISSEVADCSSAAVAMPAMRAEFLATRSRISCRAVPEAPASSVASVTLLLAAVNLNTATVEELKTLPGIGPAKAAAIVEYRSQNGNFKSVDEVKKVKGIGEGVFNKLKDEATVAAPAKPAKSAAPIKK